MRIVVKGTFSAADRTSYRRRADYRSLFKTTRQIADELNYAGVLPADVFIDMDSSDPEWFVALYVRKAAFIWAIKKWLSRARNRQHIWRPENAGRENVQRLLLAGDLPSGR